MFTGIIKEVGRVKKIIKKSNLWQIDIISSILYEETNVSDSISVNGICLTLVKKTNNTLSFEAIKHTLNLTNLKRLKINDRVNLEPSLKVNDKLGGHLLLGHIDCESRIRKIEKKRDYQIWHIDYPLKYQNNIIEKGSIAIDGISLTVSKLTNTSFLVNIIPYTLEHTNLKDKRVGDWVNIEFDYLTKIINKNKIGR